jgi:hypothetical protein
MKGWFKTGGTTEITGNFVPVDVMVVGFMIFGRMNVYDRAIERAFRAA